jgi:hypothetical protein
MWPGEAHLLQMEKILFEGYSCIISRTTKEQAVTDRGVIAIAEGCPELNGIMPGIQDTSKWRTEFKRERERMFEKCRWFKIL